MKRSPELAGLSRDHHVALSHALALRRATAEDLPQVLDAFLAFIDGDGRRHFAEEEEVLAPESPDDLAARMLREHEEILGRAERLGAAPALEPAHELGELMSAHVRFEERELFPALETTLPPERLRAIGARLADH